MKRILAIILSIAILVMAFPISVFAAEPASATDTWDGSTSEPTETDADGNIIINTAEELAWIALKGHNATAGKSYKVAEGIDAFYLTPNGADSYDNSSFDRLKETLSAETDLLGDTLNKWHSKSYNVDDGGWVAFQGSFDGNGITIYGMPGVSTDAGTNALFPSVKGDVAFKKFTLTDSYITSKYNVGGIVGAGFKNESAINSISFEKCIVKGNYLEQNTLGNSAGWCSLGGLAASIAKVTESVNVNNCLITDNNIVNASSAINKSRGFFANWLNYDTAVVTVSIKNSITDMNPYSNGYYPNNPANYSNVYTTCTDGADYYTSSYTDSNVKVLTADQMKGAAAQTNIVLSWNSDWFVGEEGEYPSINFGDPVVDPYLWDGTFTEPTETDAEGNIIINTPSEMAWVALRGATATAGKNYKVADDVEYFNMNGMAGITVDSTSEDVKSAIKFESNAWRFKEDDKTGAFCGNFDGNGVTIYNIYSAKGRGYGGLFPVVKPASADTITIKNVAVVASHIGGYHFAGGIVGLADAPDTSTGVLFENCVVKNNYIYDNDDANSACSRTAGAIAGGLSHNATTINNALVVNNDITAQGVVGGIFGNTSNYGGAIAVNNSIVVDTNFVPKAGTILLGTKVSGTTYTNVYTNQEVELTGTTLLAADDMIGYKATLKMEALNNSDWFFSTTTYPEPSVFHNVVNGECDCGLIEATDPCLSGHKLTAISGVDATAFTDGFKAHDKCTACGKTFIDGNEVTNEELVIPSLAKKWDGTVSEPTTTDAEGNIVINTPEELAWIALKGGEETAGINYKVAEGSVFNMCGMAGISATSTAAEVKAADKNDTRKWQTESDNINIAPFMGNFNGNGLIVYNIYTAKGRGFGGLFPVIKPQSSGSVTIKNVTVLASHIGGYHYAGGIIGLANAPDTSTELILENCVVKNCYIYDNDDANSACFRTTGTLVGSLLHNSSTINNCLAVNNELSAQGIIGGIFGNTSNYGGANTVTNVISIGNEVQPMMVNTIINDKVNNTTYVNVYTDKMASANGVTILTTEEMQGAAAADNMKLNWNINWAIGAEGEYPSIIFNNSFYDDWDGTFSEPTTTDAEGNIIINTAEEMAWVALRGDAATTGKNYKVADGIKYFNMNGMVGITLNSSSSDVKNATKDTAKYWNYENDGKVGTFYGNFDGNGVTIYNIYAKKGQGYGGLFPVIKPESAGTLTIKNVAVVASYIGGYHCAGGIIGLADAPDTSTKLLLENIIVKNNFIYDNDDANAACQRTAGAIVGNLTHNAAVINNCFISGNELSAQGIVGGLFGNSSIYAAASTVSNVISLGTSIAPASVSGTVSEKVANTVYTNVYTDLATELTGVTTLTIDEMTGENALTNTTLDWNGWFATTKLPEIRAFHNVTYTDNGDGTHSESCADCTVVGFASAHNFVKGVCACGAEDETPVMYGDVNGDGRINGRDYAMLLQYVNSWGVSIDEVAADVNADGKINGRDYAMLLQYVNNWGITLGPKN